MRILLLSTYVIMCLEDDFSSDKARSPFLLQEWSRQRKYYITFLKSCQSRAFYFGKNPEKIIFSGDQKVTQCIIFQILFSVFVLVVWAILSEVQDYSYLLQYFVHKTGIRCILSLDISYKLCIYSVISIIEQLPHLTS